MHDYKHATWGRDLGLGLFVFRSCRVDIFPAMIELVYSN
jgi:hypothetical protein